MDATTVFHPFVFQVLASFVLFWFIFKWFDKPNRAKNLPPSPPKLPILGNLHQLSQLPHKDLQRMARIHGPLMLLRFGTVPTLVVSSVEGAREILKTHDLDFADRPESWLTKRLLYDHKDVSTTPYGKYWRQMKSIMVFQLLNKKRVQSSHSIREEETSILLQKIRESSGPLNLHVMFSEVANDIISRSAVGMKLRDGEKGKKFLSMLDELMNFLGTAYIGDFVPWLSWVTRFTGLNARVDKLARELDEFMEGVIDESMARIPTEKDEDYQNKNGENFVDIMVDIYKNNSAGASIDRDSVKATILGVFAAGTDTTYLVLIWAMSELLRHPEVMKRLQNEVREITKGKHDITDEDLEKMHYLKAVFKETLRLHPPIPSLVTRVARKNVKLMGYDIPSRTRVMINAWAIGRDPSIWNEPEKFNPDRFLNSSIDLKGQDFELIPFGAGRRGCPAIPFAMVTDDFILANVVQKFEWKLADEGKELDMSERPGIVIHKAVPLLAVASEYHS